MMKRLVFIGLLLLGCGTAWCQTADSTGRTLGDTPQLRRSRTQNVIGTPVYYDTLGNVIGGKTVPDSMYHRPKHHFHNRLENDFCSVFLEGQTRFSGNDVAVGCQLAWVPRRWGVYGSGMVGVRHGYFSAGPVWRMSDCGNWIDWQLYGGLVVSRQLGAEIGLRMGSPKMWGDFCWSSVSFNWGYVNGASYVTLGLSLTLTSIVALSIW